MIEVDARILTAMQSRRDFKNVATMTLANGVVLELDPSNFTVSGNNVVDGSGASGLPIGEAIAKSISITLENGQYQFDDYNFIGATIDLGLWLDVDNDGVMDSWEIIPKGLYTVVSPVDYGDSIEITAIDEMWKADRKFVETWVTFPCTVASILTAVCSHCDIDLATGVFDKTTMQTSISEIPSGMKGATCRQIIGWCAMFAGANARIRVTDNALEFVYLSAEALNSIRVASSVNGGSFDSATPYATGDEVDGGYFWGGGSAVDGGVFAWDTEGYTLSSWNAIKVDTDDVEVTGLEALVNQTAYHTTEYSEDYLINLSNPLFEKMTTYTVVQLLDRLGADIIGMKFRRFEGTHIADPLLEFGDCVVIQDRRQRTAISWITDITFNVLGFTTLRNKSNSALVNQSTYTKSAESNVVNAEISDMRYDIADLDTRVSDLEMGGGGSGVLIRVVSSIPEDTAPNVLYLLRST